MSAVTRVLQDLVQRRLWPVAVLLIVAAIAAPVLLASEPEPVSAPPVAGAAAQAQPIASLVDTFSADARRRVLGAAKDPFRPSGRQPEAPTSDSGSTAPSAIPATPGSGAATASRAGAGPGGAGSSGGGSFPSPGGTGSGSSPSPAGAPPTGPLTPGPTAPAPTPGSEGQDDSYALHSLKVRVDEGEPRELERLAPLPDEESASVIYLGLLSKAKTAVFLLDEGVTTEGDGACRPSPQDCRRVHLKKGETQFFTVPPAGGEGMATEFQLDLLSIKTKRTSSSARAKRAYAASSKAGRRALRGRTDRVGRLRYDARTGVLRRLSVKAHRAALARAAQR